MEQTKQKLTNLVETINQSFPEGNDLKGFLGISKKLIINILEQCIAMVEALKEYDNTFEVIVLKRELVEVFEKVDKTLSSGYDSIKESQFESLLKQITRLKSLIKGVYISVISSGPLRTEEQIIKAKTELESLVSNKEEIKTIHNEIIQLKTNAVTNITGADAEVITQKESAIKIIKENASEIDQLKNSTATTISLLATEMQSLKESASQIEIDLKAKQSEAIVNSQTITDFLQTIETNKQTIEIISTNTTEWNKEIQKSKEDIATRAKEYQDLNNKLVFSQKSIDDAYYKIFGKANEEG